MTTYSFLDVFSTITGPGGAVDFGAGAGVAEEGITIERDADKNTKTIGADGAGMNNLRANKSGRVTVRLLKTSPTNALLSTMYDLQSLSSAVWGQNVIVVSNPAAGDITTCRQCAFKQYPVLKYAGEGGMNEWSFDAILIDSIIGVAA